jgi:hypothetical protein
MSMRPLVLLPLVGCAAELDNHEIGTPDAATARDCLATKVGSCTPIFHAADLAGDLDADLFGDGSDLALAGLFVLAADTPQTFRGTAEVPARLFGGDAESTVGLEIRGSISAGGVVQMVAQGDEVGFEGHFDASDEGDGLVLVGTVHAMRSPAEWFAESFAGTEWFAELY